jgi:hypothetical protein
MLLTLSLPLALLVPGVLADHTHDAVALDDLAVLTTSLDRRPDLHDILSPWCHR